MILVLATCFGSLNFFTIVEITGKCIISVEIIEDKKVLEALNLDDLIIKKNNNQCFDVVDIVNYFSFEKNKINDSLDEYLVKKVKKEKFNGTKK